jgi:hypothetical protein
LISLANREADVLTTDRTLNNRSNPAREHDLPSDPHCDLSSCFLIPLHRTTHPSKHLTCAALNQAGGKGGKSGKGGGQTNNQAAQAIAQGKNPGGINQGQAGEGVVKNSSISMLSQNSVSNLKVMGTLHE